MHQASLMAGTPLEGRQWRGAQAALGAWVALGLALTIVLAARVAPAAALAVPALLLGLGLLVLVGRHPLGHLAAVLAVFTLTAKYKDGIQVEEVLFALYYAGYLAHWYTTRLAIRRERLLRNPADVAVAFFLVYMTGSLVLTVLFGGVGSSALSEWVNFSMLAFYFPVKEACERHRSGPALISALILVWGCYVFVQNTIVLRSAFADAEQAWQIARGRVAMNEMLLLIPAIWTATFAARARSPRMLSVLALGFSVFTVGVLLTQWRAYYIDLAVAVILLGFLLRGWERTRLLGFVTLGVLGIGVVGMIVFSDVVMLIALGLADRILSIGTATQIDVSLLNRLLETAQVWELIKANPILGYGMGVEFGFYDAIFKATWVKTYVHNGYLMLWYKFGIIGLTAIMVVWIRSIVIALRVARSEGPARFESTLALFTGVALISILPSHAVSATFVTGDTVLMFAVLTGLASGLEVRPPTLRTSDVRA